MKKKLLSLLFLVTISILNIQKITAKHFIASGSEDKTIKIWNVK